MRLFKLTGAAYVNTFGNLSSQSNTVTAPSYQSLIKELKKSQYWIAVNGVSFQVVLIEDITDQDYEDRPLAF